MKNKAVAIPRNAKEWRTLSSQVVADMLNGVRDHNMVKEVTNAFGKQITLARVQIEHAVQRRQKPNVAWLRT